MLTLVEMKFGSHLYGTNTASSDLDIKAVHLPDARDILLQQAKPVISRQTKADPTAKNTSGDEDFESYSLQKYLMLVAQGQTVALDMLFAPDFALLSEPHPIWREIQANKARLLTCRYASFVDYCRQQANKYGIRGSRVAASRAALEILSLAVETRGAAAKLGEIASTIDTAIEKTEHMALVDQMMPGEVMVRHWEVCGRKMPFTSSIKSARDIMAKLVAEYGQRSLQAETNNGVDWKALSHAVRIGRQAIEVLEAGNVVFPRPDAAHLLAVKKGGLAYQVVADEIEQLLVDIELASARSTLPDAPDHAWIDGLIERAHFQIVRQSRCRTEVIFDGAEAIADFPTENLP